MSIRRTFLHAAICCRGDDAPCPWSDCASVPCRESGSGASSRPGPLTDCGTPLWMKRY